MNDTTLVQVRNRNNGTTGYTLDGDFHRDFNPEESKKVPFSELRQLSYAPGGQYILDNYLVIEDQEALDLLNMTVEPEYFYTEDKVKELLFTGSIDAFADFLDFAPKGAIEIAKNIAIKEQIPDIRKRNMLSEKTGLNINNAIMVNEIIDAEDETTEEAPKQRRVQVENNVQSETPKRRAEAPASKIIIKK
jgi:hypothetical protein